MRKAFILLLVLAVVSCRVPVDGKDGTDGTPGVAGVNGAPGADGKDGVNGKDATAPTPNLHVVNSAWKTVYETTISSARSIDSTDFIAIMVADYNAAHTDDQWRVIYGDVPDVSVAPSADAYIVDAKLDRLAEYHGLARSSVETRRTELAEIAAAREGTLYIDKTPPAPEPVHVVTDYERFALYLVAADGSILFEEHCKSAEEYALRKSCYELQAQADGAGEYVVAGRLYP